MDHPARPSFRRNFGDQSDDPIRQPRGCGCAGGGILEFGGILILIFVLALLALALLGGGLWQLLPSLSSSPTPSPVPILISALGA